MVRTAIYDSEIKGIEVPDDPTALPFNDLFGDNLRVAFKMLNDGLNAIITALEGGRTKSGKKYKVDLENQKAIWEVKTERGPKIMSAKLGRVIRKELSQREANEWSRQMAAIAEGRDKDNYMIILSRSPVDVVRMSDFPRIRSCHSVDRKNTTGAMYFPSARSEALVGGPISYVVDQSDFESIEDLQAPEIFSDPERDIEGIVPLARMRVNRYHHKKRDFDVAMPVTRTYGSNFAGFMSTVTNWLREKQKEIYESSNIHITDFERHGGTYADRRDEDIFGNFFGENTYTGTAEHVGAEGDEENLVEMWQQEVDGHLQRAQDLDFVSLWAEVEVGDDGAPYMYISGNLRQMRFSNFISGSIPTKKSGHITTYYDPRSPLKTMFWKMRDDPEIDNSVKERFQTHMDNWSIDLPGMKEAIIELAEAVPKLRPDVDEILKTADEKHMFATTIGKIKDAVSNLCDVGYPEDLEIEIDVDDLLIGVSLIFENIDNPDDLSGVVNDAERFEEKNGYETLYAEIYEILSEARYVEPSRSLEFMEEYDFKNIDVEFDEDSSSYQMQTSFMSVPIPKTVLDSETSMGELKNNISYLLTKWFEQSYAREQEGLLFPLDFPDLKLNSLPKPVILINNLPITSVRPLPYSVLSIGFELTLNNIIEADAHTLTTFLKTFDAQRGGLASYIQERIKQMVDKEAQKVDLRQPEQDTQVKEQASTEAFINHSWYRRAFRNPDALP